MRIRGWQPSAQSKGDRAPEIMQTRGARPERMPIRRASPAARSWSETGATAASRSTLRALVRRAVEDMSRNAETAIQTTAPSAGQLVGTHCATPRIMG